MKKLLAIILALALLTAPALAYGAGTGPALYVNETDLAEGLTYENAIAYTSGGRRTETFTLTNTPKSEVRPIVLACDTIYGGLTVTQMVSYAESLGYNVVGAVNSDFGYWDTRIPCGMAVEDGIYKTSPEGNNALAFFEDGTAEAFYMPEINITLTNDATGESISTTHLNKTRQDGGLYLYSEYFSTVSTRTSGEGKFVRFTVPDGADLTLSGELKLTVAEIIEGETAVKIGADNLILTATAASELDVELSKFAVGDAVTLKTTCSDEKLSEAQWVSGCGNILVQNSAEYLPEYWDKSISGANPRTAVGIMADGSICYYVMDGRTASSNGATMKELAADLISMGCVSAVNMDGGGSTAMALRMPGRDKCTVVNVPSDGALRAVCTYILFVTDAKPDGVAKRLFLKEDGAFVLSGSSMDLTVLATDAGLHSTKAPPNVTLSPTRGSVTGNVYTAAGGGNDVIALSSALAKGSATIHAVSRPQTVSVADKSTGKAVTSLDVERGDTVSLVASARYYLRALYADADAFKFSLTGDIGTITEDGVYTAEGKASAEGVITVECAGVKTEIPVKLGFEFDDMRGHWAAEYVSSLYEKGVVNGTGDGTTFSPDEGMKRRDFMVMLHRAAGSPAPSAPCPFTDVPAEDYYTAAVAWAAEKGIAQGSGEGIFDPEGTLTREQGFAFLHRALPVLAIETAPGTADTLADFTDADTLSDWARESAASLVAMGIVDGDGGALTPKGTLTRCQMAKLLWAAVYDK